MFLQFTITRHKNIIYNIWRLLMKNIVKLTNYDPMRVTISNKYVTSLNNGLIFDQNYFVQSYEELLNISKKHLDVSNKIEPFEFNEIIGKITVAREDIKIGDSLVYTGEIQSYDKSI